jgi:AAA domain
VYLRIAEPQIRTALRDTRVVAISDPRQSGKTTLVRRFAKQGCKFVALDNQSTLAAAKSDPVTFIRGLDRAVIDEVQRAPDLLLAFKQSVDEDRRAVDRDAGVFPNSFACRPNCIRCAARELRILGTTQAVCMDGRASHAVSLP